MIKYRYRKNPQKREERCDTRVKAENLPQKLREQGLFCLWRYEQQGERRTKMPYNPNFPQERAKSNDQTTFSPIGKATAAAEQGRFDGIGIGIFGSLAGIDIDRCIDDAGKLSPMAQDIVQTMNAYTEISPSGTGLRILFYAPGFSYDKDSYYIKESKQGLEIYIAGMTQRYLTVTGNTMRNSDLVDRSKELQLVLDKYMKRKREQPADADAWQYTRATSSTAAELTDRELLDIAMNAKNGSTFSALWNGDISNYPSHSEADLSLCNLLASWTNKDAARIDSLFRQSGLMRDKWDRRQSGTTYGAITIDKAIAGCKDGYTPPRKAPESPQTGRNEQQGSNAAVDKETPQKPTERAKTSTELFDMFLDKVQTETYKPLKTGMQSFDDLLGGGILRQSVAILTAAPGTGKTSLTQQIFETMAANGAPVVFLNLEMSREQLLARSLSRMIHKQGHSMNAADVLKGYKWTDAQRGFVMDAAADYRKRIAPNFVYNPENMGNTYQSIGAVLKRYGEAMKAQGRCAPVVVLDYLHIVQSDKKEDAAEIIKATVQMLKDYAMEYDTFVFVLSASNRASNQKGTQSLESSRDSSGVEYSADYLLSLNYKALALKEKKDDGKPYQAGDPNDMELLQKQSPRQMLVQVLKNRMNAAGGKLQLEFDSANSTFTPIVKQTYDRYTQDGFENVTDRVKNPFL